MIYPDNPYETPIGKTGITVPDGTGNNDTVLNELNAHRIATLEEADGRLKKIVNSIKEFAHRIRRTDDDLNIRESVIPRQNFVKGTPRNSFDGRAEINGKKEKVIDDGIRV